MKTKLILAALLLTSLFGLHTKQVLADEVVKNPAEFKAQDMPPEPSAEVEIPMSRPTLTPVADEINTPSDLPPEPEVIVRDGPLTNERSELLRTIYLAKEKGIGITNYMKAFEYIEDMAAKNQPDEAIQKRIDSLKGSLEEQLKRSDQIKTDLSASSAQSGSGAGRKLGPGNLLADPQAIPSSFRDLHGGAGGQSKELLDMIVADKLGGKLPSQMSKQELQKKMKEVPELEDYLKRFK